MESQVKTSQTDNRGVRSCDKKPEADNVALLVKFIGRLGDRIGNQFKDLREIPNNGFDMMNKMFDQFDNMIGELVATNS